MPELPEIPSPAAVERWETFARELGRVVAAYRRSLEAEGVPLEERTDLCIAFADGMVRRLSRRR
jgi:hypothetical protein